MNVLHIIDKLEVGGAEKVFITLTSLLVNKGTNVAALLFDTSGKITGELDKKLQVYNLNRKSKYALTTLYRLNKTCAMYDVVHVHMRHCFVYTRLAKMLFRGKYKLILHDHYGDIDINPSVPFKLKLLKPDIYIGVSTSLQKWAVEKLDVPRKNAYLLQNTITAHDYEHSEEMTPNFCMVANFRSTKNIEFAVSLFQSQGWPLTIYGKKSDEAYYDKIAASIKKLANIRIVNDVDDFKTIAAHHNFAIHTAVSESGPLVLLEYMAAGIPFIAYRTGEVSIVVGDELNELFMDNFDEAQWINRIKEITGQKDKKEKLKNTFSKYFSNEKYVSACLKIYEEILC